jgi:hypothetical protein
MPGVPGAPGAPAGPATPARLSQPYGIAKRLAHSEMINGISNKATRARHVRHPFASWFWLVLKQGLSRGLHAAKQGGLPRTYLRVPACPVLLLLLALPCQAREHRHSTRLLAWPQHKRATVQIVLKCANSVRLFGCAALCIRSNQSCITAFKGVSSPLTGCPVLSARTLHNTRVHIIS